jgi:hypothetical protein
MATRRTQRPREKIVETEQTQADPFVPIRLIPNAGTLQSLGLLLVVLGLAMCRRI